MYPYALKANSGLHALALGVLLFSGGAVADDVSGTDRVLCSTLEANLCAAGAGCTAIVPTEHNIPQFIEVDFKARKLATTEASGENRETIAGQASRSEGRMLLQGHEGGRAFSLMIAEDTGQATFAAAGGGRAVTAFAACTPMHGK